MDSFAFLFAALISSSCTKANGDLLWGRKQGGRGGVVM